MLEILNIKNGLYLHWEHFEMFKEKRVKKVSVANIWVPGFMFLLFNFERKNDIVRSFDPTVIKEPREKHH